PSRALELGPRARLGPGLARGVGRGAGAAAHLPRRRIRQSLQRLIGVRDLGGARVLHSDDLWRLSSAAHAARRRAAVSRTWIPLRAGVLSCRCGDDRRSVGSLSADDNLARHGDRIAGRAGVFYLEATT